MHFAQHATRCSLWSWWNKDIQLKASIILENFQSLMTGFRFFDVTIRASSVFNPYPAWLSSEREKGI